MNVRVLAAAVAAAVVIGGGALFFLSNSGAPGSTAEVPSAATTPATGGAATPAAPADETPRPAPTRQRRTDNAPAAAETPAPAAPAAEPAPVAGLLRIDADVPGAQVFIDRQFVGATPVTANNVKPGSHQLNVSMEGYDGIAQTIDVEPGPREITVSFKQVRLDAKIDVIHKHRMGSCKGRLVATPTGMRYETTDKDDAFTVALPDLEMFQVDYLEKNLKVKPRKGKQYNFTDPDGNADRLFVFHRDVEKARERMKNAN